MLILYTHATGEALTGVVGSIPDRTQAFSTTFLLDSLPLSNIVTPGEGSGTLWVYSKHYFNVFTFDGATGASDVSICLLSADSPDQIYLAPALTHDEGITGSHHYGVQTGLPWTDTEPSFVKGQGWDNSILLTNGSGDLGSVVGIGTATGDLLGFWLARRFTENYEFTGPTGTGHINFGISAQPS